MYTKKYLQGIQRIVDGACAGLGYNRIQKCLIKPRTPCVFNTPQNGNAGKWILSHNNFTPF